MRVLLVEDEFLIREIMSESLRDAGYEVVDVENGQVAVELMRQPPKQFSLLVTDFHMPGDVDGSQVASKLRETHPSIPVIIVSGRPDVMKASWQTQFGYRLLKKPFLPSDLTKLVRSMIGPPPLMPVTS